MPGLPDLRDCVCLKFYPLDRILTHFSQNFFPPLSRLPHDTELSESEYYTLSASTSIYRALFMPNSNNMTLRRRRHWCLLAEIVELNFWPFRPMYKVKDITGQTFLAAFHFDDRTWFPKVEREAIVGSTICVMYAELHYFADGQVGVRLEEPSNVKVGNSRLWLSVLNIYTYYVDSSARTRRIGGYGRESSPCLELYRCCTIMHCLW